MNRFLMSILLFGVIGILSGGLSGCSQKAAATGSTVAADTTVRGTDEGRAAGTLGEDGSGLETGEAAEYPAQETGGENAGEAEYPEYLEATVGLFNYYNQNDPRWADKLYGTDPIDAYGCGPTVLAMVVSYFTGETITPDEMASWAAESGFCRPGQGSSHDIIPSGLSAYGLKVEGMADRSPETVYQALRDGYILVALVDRGYFTEKGHFLILIKANENRTIRIADPANAENNSQDWKPEFIIDQLKTNAVSGGPLWKIGYGE